MLAWKIKVYIARTLSTSHNHLRFYNPKTPVCISESPRRDEFFFHYTQFCAIFQTYFSFTYIYVHRRRWRRRKNIIKHFFLCSFCYTHSPHKCEKKILNLCLPHIDKIMLAIKLYIEVLCNQECNAKFSRFT